jgi:hypothetical protein
MGAAVTVASLTGSGCAEEVCAGLSALEAAPAGSAGFRAGLSVGSGAPGLSLIACGFNLIGLGTGSGARACGARICFVTLGLTIGAGAFVTRGATLATGFSGAGFTARAMGFCGGGFEARATGLDI